jgi:hypothetical protein
MSDDDSDTHSDIEDFRVALQNRAEDNWFIEHYDVLQQLYCYFKTVGETLFGNWFFQSGGFHHFVHFVYVHSQLSSKPP